MCPREKEEDKGMGLMRKEMAKQKKKTYARPALKQYGALRQMTQGGSGVQAEGTSTMIGMN